MRMNEYYEWLRINTQKLFSTKQFFAFFIAFTNICYKKLIIIIIF